MHSIYFIYFVVWLFLDKASSPKWEISEKSAFQHTFFPILIQHGLEPQSKPIILYSKSLSFFIFFDLDP
jgi:hypothetical protein